MEGLTRMLGVRLPAAQFQALHEKARRYDLTVSQLIRLAIRELLRDTDDERQQ